LLRQPESKLEEFYLDNERYQTKLRPKLDINAIAAALKDNNTLKILGLSDNLINDQEFEALPLLQGERIGHHVSLEKKAWSWQGIVLQTLAFPSFYSHVSLILEV